MDPCGENPDLVPEEHCDIFISNLESDNLDVDVVLGDTNTKVPGRIKGKLEAYLEADASKYVLQTISEGYKLIFINDVPPLLVTFLTINPLCRNQLSCILS